MEPPIPPQRLEVRDPSGQVVGYFVPAAEADRLKAELDRLKAQVAGFQAAGEEVRRLAEVLTPLPPMTDEEVREMLASPLESFSDLVAEIEAMVAANDGR